MEKPTQTKPKSNKKRIFLILFVAGLSLLWSLCYFKITPFHSAQPTDQKAPTTDYLVCSIDDDPEGYNTHGIYNPNDLAVTVNRLKLLGVDHLFLGTHLHWPNLDEFDNNTLRTQLEKLDSCTLSVPLRRTSVGVDLPDYLENTSVPISSIHGDISKLPAVNNLSLAPTLSIPNNAMVGFSQLETEPVNTNIPLLARWGDKVLLSSLLLERIHHNKSTIAELEIHLGRSITLGSSEFTIPINGFGYFKPKSQPKSADPDIISSNITNIEESPSPSSNAILTASGKTADNYRTINTPFSLLVQINSSSTESVQSWLINLLYLTITLSLLALLISVMKHVSVALGFKQEAKTAGKNANLRAKRKKQNDE